MIELATKVFSMLGGGAELLPLINILISLLIGWRLHALSVRVTRDEERERMRREITLANRLQTLENK